MKVKINNEYENVQCIAELYDQNNTFLGLIKNEYQLNDIRIQIKKQQLEGYYLIFIDEKSFKHKLLIDKSGRICAWPKGFFDLTQNQLFELL